MVAAAVVLVHTAMITSTVAINVLQIGNGVDLVDVITTAMADSEPVLALAVVLVFLLVVAVDRTMVTGLTLVQVVVLTLVVLLASKDMITGVMVTMVDLVVT